MGTFRFNLKVKSLIVFRIVLALAFGSNAGYVYADATLPSGEEVVHGQASFDRNTPDTLNVNQGTNELIANWQDFSIGSNGTVNFYQPSSSSVALNRVVSMQPSEIFGALNANGNIFLINPNGILFAPGSSVNVAGLVASTLNISNEDFLNGNYSFYQDPSMGPSYVINQGIITVEEGGDVSLIGGAVSNDGVIYAPLGSVNLISGRAVTLQLDGQGLIYADVKEAVEEEVFDNNGEKVQDGVANAGTITANGGRVAMKAEAASGVFDKLVNQTGIVRAQSLVEHDGVIMLVSSSPGIVQNTGEIDVSAAEAGVNGGSVTMEGDMVGQFGQVHADAIEGDGGDVDLYASSVVALSSDSVTTANAGTNGDGGEVIAFSDGQALFRPQARIEAKGGELSGDGGFVEVSGVEHVEVFGSVDASAANGEAGTFLIDPSNITIDNSNSNNMNTPPNYTPAGNNSIVGDQHIEGYLNAGTNVTITTAGAGTQPGNITQDSDAQINTTPSSNTSLTLTADGRIRLNGGIVASGANSLDVNLNATTDVDINAAINTNSGSFTASGVNFDNTDGVVSTGGGAINVSLSGDATIDSLNAGAGNVTVTSSGGAILAAAGSINVQAIGDSVSLTAPNGIGDFISTTEIVIDLGTGTLTLDTSAGTGDILVVEGNGDLYTSNISLTTAGGSTQNVGIINGNGDFYIDNVFPFGGTSDDNLLLGAVVGSGNTIFQNGGSQVFTTNTAIIGGTTIVGEGLVQTDIDAATVVFITGDGAGTSLTPIETDVADIAAFNQTSNDINVSNNGALQIATVSVPGMGVLSGITNDAVGGSVNLNAAGITQTDPITADNLEIVSSGAVTLTNASNDVDTLAVDMSGAGATDDLSFVNNNALEIAAGSWGTPGIRMNGGDVGLNTAGTLTQTAEISANNLEIISSGTVDLDNVNNSINTLAVDMSGAGLADYLALYNNTSLSIGTGGIWATPGIVMNTGETALLGVDGTLTQTAPIDADTLVIVSSGAVTLTNPNNNVGNLNVDMRPAGPADAFQFVNLGPLSVFKFDNTLPGIITDGDITLTTLDSGGPIDNLTIENGAVVESTTAGSTITLNADDDFIIQGTGSVVAGAGTVSVTSSNGAILSPTDPGNIEIIGDSISLTAPNGIGSRTVNEQLDIDLGAGGLTLDTSSGTGDIAVYEANGDLYTSSISLSTNTGSTQDITIATRNGHFYIDSIFPATPPVSNDVLALGSSNTAFNVIFDGAGRVYTTNNVGLGGGAIIGNNINQTDIDAAGVIFFAFNGIGHTDPIQTDVVQISANNDTSNDINIINNGDLDITTVTPWAFPGITNNAAGGNVSLNTAGALTQTDPIIANGLEIIADGAVTLTNTGNRVNTLAVNMSGAPIIPPPADLDFVNGGGGTLTVGVGATWGTVGIIMNEGDVNVTASSPLTINSDIIQAGNITLTASDSATTLDHLTLNANVTSTVAGSTITLDAGDDIIQNAGFTVQNTGGAGTIIATADHEGALDAYRGSFIQGAGASFDSNGGTITVNSYGDATIGLLNAGAGTVNVNPTNGAINSANYEGTADVVGSTVNLNAGAGGIGTTSVLEVTATAALNADTTADNANIFIDGIGSLPIGLVNAGSGDVTLDSTGSLIPVSHEGVPDVVGSTLNLTGATGIGIDQPWNPPPPTPNPLEVSYTTQLNLTTTSVNPDYPIAGPGDIYVDILGASPFDINVNTAAGGHNIVFNFGVGNLVIDRTMNFTGGDTVTFASGDGNDIIFDTSVSPVDYGNINSDGTVVLNAGGPSGGAIIDNTGSLTNITAVDLALIANGNIGTIVPDNPIEIDVTNLTGESTNGVFNVLDTDTLSTGVVTGYTPGITTNNQEIRLAVTTGDLTIGAGAPVMSNGGDIRLRVGNGSIIFNDVVDSRTSPSSVNDGDIYVENVAAGDTIGVGYTGDDVEGNTVDVQLDPFTISGNVLAGQGMIWLGSSTAGDVYVGVANFTGQNVGIITGANIFGYTNPPPYSPVPPVQHLLAADRLGLDASANGYIGVIPLGVLPGPNNPEIVYPLNIQADELEARARFDININESDDLILSDPNSNIAVTSLMGDVTITTGTQINYVPVPAPDLSGNLTVLQGISAVNGNVYLNVPQQPNIVPGNIYDPLGIDTRIITNRLVIDTPGTVGGPAWNDRLDTEVTDIEFLNTLNVNDYYILEFSDLNFDQVQPEDIVNTITLGSMYNTGSSPVYGHLYINLFAHDGGTIGDMNNPFLILAYVGQARVGAEGARNEISINIIGTVYPQDRPVDPSDRLHITNVPPGLVLFNYRLMGGGNITNIRNRGYNVGIREGNYLSNLSYGSYLNNWNYGTLLNSKLIDEAELIDNQLVYAAPALVDLEGLGYSLALDGNRIVLSGEDAFMGYRVYLPNNVIYIPYYLLRALPF